MLIHNINYTIQQPLPSSYAKNEYIMNYRKKEGKKRKKNIFYVKVTLEEKNTDIVISNKCSDLVAITFLKTIFVFLHT